MKLFNKRRSAKTERLLYQKLLIALGVGFAASILVVALTSLAFEMNNMPLSMANLFSSAALLVGSFVSGYIFARQIGEKGLKQGAICGAVYFLIFLIVSLAFGNRFGTLAVIKAVIITIAASLGGVYGVNRKKKRIKIKNI